MEPLVLTGVIFKDEDGIFVSHCHELDIETCGESLEELRHRTESMIRSYFKACQKLGTYEQILRRLNATTTVLALDPSMLPFRTNFEYKHARI